MENNQKELKRRSIRLTNYDYSGHGAYFVTICAHEHACVFGFIQNENMILNDLGKIALHEWHKTAQIRKDIRLDNFVVMPNHVHGVIWLIDEENTVPRARTYEKFGQSVKGSLPTIIRAYKAAVCKRINVFRNTPGAVVWQRNYWEHVVRNNSELNILRDYIVKNPVRWHLDKLNKNRVTNKS